MSDLVLESFAGPGGWSEGLRLAGFQGRAVGVEHDLAACRTAMAAGHQRIQADAASFPLAHMAGKVDGLIQSPPCQAWSNAGDQLGKLDQPRVFERIAAFDARRPAPVVQWADPRSHLTAEPMRWAVALRPRWIALEQVPPVLPLWQFIGERLREHGYRVWCGILSAEQYGVPQTRRRAILLARRDGRPVGPPVPTHQAYRAGRAPVEMPDLFGEQLPPPVSMAEALGWAGADRPARTVCGDRSPRWAYGQGNSYATGWTLADVVMTNGGDRSIEDPSLTITASLDNGNMRWTAGRPATKVCGDARLAPPGHRDREGGERQFGEDTVRVTVQEAAVLQSFRPDYPWYGTKSEKYSQVGNAVPPLLAAAVLRQFVDTSAGEVAA